MAITPAERRGMRALIKAAMSTVQPERFWADWLRCLDALDSADAVAAAAEHCAHACVAPCPHTRQTGPALAAYRALVEPR